MNLFRSKIGLFVYHVKLFLVVLIIEPEVIIIEFVADSTLSHKRIEKWS